MKIRNFENVFHFLSIVFIFNVSLYLSMVFFFRSAVPVRKLSQHLIE